MGTTSSAVKRKWNAQHYKQVAVQLDKELVARWEDRLKEDNVPKAEFIRNAIKAYLGE